MIEIKHEAPSVVDYRNLRKVAGLVRNHKKLRKRALAMHVLM